MHLNRIDGVAFQMNHAVDWLAPDVRISLDRVIDKGEIGEQHENR